MYIVGLWVLITVVSRNSGRQHCCRQLLYCSYFVPGILHQYLEFFVLPLPPLLLLLLLLLLPMGYDSCINSCRVEPTICVALLFPSVLLKDEGLTLARGGHHKVQEQKAQKVLKFPSQKAEHGCCAPHRGPWRASGAALEGCRRPHPA